MQAPVSVVNSLQPDSDVTFSDKGHHTDIRKSNYYADEGWTNTTEISTYLVLVYESKIELNPKYTNSHTQCAFSFPSVSTHYKGQGSCFIFS